MEHTIYQQKGRFTNVGPVERGLSAITGGILLGLGVVRPGWQKAVFALPGTYLLYRGITGHCTIYRWLNINRTEAGRGGIQVERAITIFQPIEEVYAFWRQLENLPRFMQHLERVEELDRRRSRWVAMAPLGATVEWESEIVNDLPNQEIGWRSMPGSQIENSGTVRFKPAPGQKGTEVYVQLQYRPPGGSAGSAIAKLMGEEPDVQIREDLRRLKSLMETGDILTVEGQSSGRGGMIR